MTKTKKNSISNMVEGLTLIEAAYTQINQISDLNDKTIASLACGFFYRAASCFGKTALIPQEANLAKYTKTYPNATNFLSMLCSLANSQKNKEVVVKPKK